MKKEIFKKKLFQAKVDKYELVGQAKLSGDFNSTLKTFNSVQSHPFIKALVKKGALPSKISDLRNTRGVSYVENFGGEVAWNLFVLKDFSKPINEFLSCKASFEKNFLLGNYEDAERIINEVIDNFGYSFWVLENLFLLKEYKYGEEENWNFLSEVVKQNNDPFTLFFFENLSKRAESKISYFRYNNLFNNQLSDVSGTNAFTEYLCFRLNYPAFYGFEYFSYFLALESVSSVIDRYLLLTDIFVEVFVNPKENELDTLKSALSYMSGVFVDQRLNQLANIVGLTDEFIEFDKTNSIMEVLDLYTSGDFDGSHEKSIEVLTNEPSVVECYEVYVKSLIENGKQFVPSNISETIDLILENLYNVYKRNNKNQESTEELYKIALSFQSHQFGKQLLSLVKKQSSLSDEYLVYDLLYSLNSSFNNPRILCSTKAVKLSSYDTLKDKMNLKYQENVSYKINSYIAEGNYTSIDSSNQIAETRKSIYYGRALFNSGEHSKLKSHFESLLSIEKLSDISREEIIMGLFNTYLELDELKLATELYVNTYLDNQNFTIRLPKNSLFGKLNKLNNKGVEEIIDLPIFYSLSNSDPYERYVAYDIFMGSNNLLKPMELVSDKQLFDLDKLIYFLKEVCVIDVLKYSIEFLNPDEVDEERLEILRALLKIDNENETGYIKEITELSQNVNIKKAIQEVNKGRITVNIDQLKSNESTSVKEGFTRYKRLSEYSEGKELKAFDASSKKINEYLSSLNDESLKSKIVHLNDPAYISFKVMFLELRDKYILSKEYGLDGYLSTRIRHGALENHIRSVFQSHNIISRKDGKGKYIDHTFWTSKIGDDSVSEKLQGAIKSFSLKVDNYTSFIVNELMHIKTEKSDEKKVNALFDYSIDEQQLAALFKISREQINDDSVFLSFVFDFLEQNTEMLLAGIRNFFNTQIKEDFNTIIREFQDEVKTILGNKQYPELTTSVTKCSTHIQDEIRNISEWFYLSNPSQDLLLDVETLIQTGVEITNTIHPDNQIKPNVTSNVDFPIKGGVHLIYIFRILLDNIIYHSKVEADELGVEISTTLKDQSTLVLSFKNNIGDQVDIKELEQILEKVKDSWNSDKQEFSKINIEGGSGFEKIRRILSYDMKINNPGIDFELNDSELEIFLSIQLKFMEL